MALGLVAAWAGRASFSKSSAEVRTDRTRDVETVRRREPAAAVVSHSLESPRESVPKKNAFTPAAAPIAVRLDEPGPPLASARSGDHGATSHHPRLERATKPAHLLEPGIARRDKPSEPVDFRHLLATPNLKRLPDPQAVPPREGFWPSLAPENLENWQFADPAHVRINQEGVYLEAGPHGNFLLTSDATYRKCTLKITLAVRAGTEAFLALLARAGPTAGGRSHRE